MELSDIAKVFLDEVAERLGEVAELGNVWYLLMAEYLDNRRSYHLTEQEFERRTTTYITREMYCTQRTVIAMLFLLYTNRDRAMTLSKSTTHQAPGSKHDDNKG